MVKRQDKLSNIQYSSLITSTIIGVVVIRLPRLAVASAGVGAVLATFNSGVLATVIAVAIAILGKRFYNQTIMEYSSLILGKVLGKLFGALIALFFP